MVWREVEGGGWKVKGVYALGTVLTPELRQRWGPVGRDGLLVLGGRKRHQPVGSQRR